MMTRLPDHKSLPYLLEFFEVPSTSLVVLVTALNDGCLWDVLQASRRNEANELTPETKKAIFYQVARAVYTLHAHGISHSDIKPENGKKKRQRICKLCK